MNVDEQRSHSLEPLQEPPEAPPRGGQGWLATVRGLALAVWLPVLLSRLALGLALLFGTLLVPQLSTSRARHNPHVAWHLLPRWPVFDGLLRWDAAYYQNIAYRGYSRSPLSGETPFFPLYPLVAQLIALLMPLPAAMLTTSNLMLFVAATALYLWARRTDGDRVARRALWLLLVFPSSFFLSAGYAESTYLAGLGLLLWGWISERYAWAFGGAAAATLARPQGALTTTLPFVVGWIARSGRLRALPWCIGGAPLAAAGLSIFHWQVKGHPFAFLRTPHVAYLGSAESKRRSEASWWRIMVDEHLGPRLLRRLLNWGAVGLVLAAVVHLLRRRELELAVLCLLGLAIPIFFQKTLFDASGLLRHVLSALPLFLVLARWSERRSVAAPLTTSFAMLQPILLLAFAQWGWVE